MGKQTNQATYFFKNEYEWFKHWKETHGNPTLHSANALSNWFYVFHPVIYKRIVKELGYNPTNSELVKIIARDYPMYRRQYAIHAYNFQRDYYGN